MESAVSENRGIWAIADSHNTAFKQAMVAAGNGYIAVMDIDRYLKQRQNIKPDWGEGKR